MTPAQRGRLVKLAAAARNELRVCQEIAYTLGGDMSHYGWLSNRAIRDQIGELLIEIAVDDATVHPQEKNPISTGCRPGDPQAHACSCGSTNECSGRCANTPGAGRAPRRPLITDHATPANREATQTVGGVASHGAPQMKGFD